MKITITVNDREISGEPSIDCWEPMPASFKPWGLMPETETPTEWRQYIRDKATKAIDDVYKQIVDADLPDLDGDLLVEWAEEYLSPRLDQLIIDAVHYVGEK